MQSNARTDYIRDRIFQLDDLLSTVPRGTRNTYVDALLLQQRTTLTEASNAAVSPFSLTSAREFSRRNRSCIHALHDASGVKTSGAPEILQRSLTSGRRAVMDTSDAMLRKQRQLERAALKTMESNPWGAPTNSRKAY